MRFSSFRRRIHAHAFFMLLGVGAVVAGCSSSDTLKKLGATEVAAPSNEPSKAADSDVDCPVVTVRNGAATWQEPGGAPSTELHYQASLGQMARECVVLGPTMTIKVGVEGRVLVGPKGAPGSVAVPVRLALVAEGPQPKPIWTKFYSVPVTIPQGQSGAAFTQVEDDLTFALPASKDISNYVIYVGFDPQGAAKAKTTKRKTAPKPHHRAKPKPKKPAPQPAQQPAPQNNGGGGFAPPAEGGGFAPPANRGFAPPASGGFAPPAGQFAPPAEAPAKQQ